MVRPRSRQLTLDDARPVSGRGGWRPHAGRPRGKSRVGHEARAPFAARFPQHIALRAVEGVPSLRTPPVLAVVHSAIAAAHTAELRIVHFNLLPNHLHLLNEATGASALARGMQAFEVRIVRNLNKLLGRSGRLFDDRYYTRSLATPTEVRNALAYVLLNGNRHELENGAAHVWYGVDAYSSGAWFDGWADDRWRFEMTGTLRPTAEPKTWLLRTGWRLAGGPIEFDTYARSTSHPKLRRKSNITGEHPT